MKPKTTDTHLYIPVKLLAAIKKIAKENRRSTTAEIVIAVEEYVAAKNGKARSGK